MKVGLIGPIAGSVILAEMRLKALKHSAPLAIIKTPKISSEERQKVLEQINGSVGRATLIIEQPEIEWIPYNTKHARFIKYAMRNKKNVKLQFQKCQLPNT